MALLSSFTQFSSTLCGKDPCGMVPPIYTGPGNPITRTGLQQTYVFYKDGVETFVIRPGFQGKVEDFGMLIPFPSAPALRKVPDNVFPQIANAVDPPEVVVDLRPRMLQAPAGGGGGAGAATGGQFQFGQEEREKVVVVKQEAVGMYEVAVLEAGSAKALKKWMDLHGYQYPKGMDKVCEEYIESKWCFVAVKTSVGQKKGVNPKAGQRKTDSKRPAGSVFDGHVQGMGFRFKTDELVVPMRLSAFNEGSLRNIVYLLTDEPKKIRAIPEEFVRRQISGKQLIANTTEPLPLRIIGGMEKDLTEWHKRNLKKRRDPTPKNGVAKQLFAADLNAVSTDTLSLKHEEEEKELLRIGEYFSLRGPQIDKVNEVALKETAENAVKSSLKELEGMTLTVIDGNFPREVIANQNLTFGKYRMAARRNNSGNYDPKVNGPTNNKKKLGFRRSGPVDWSHLRSRHVVGGPQVDSNRRRTAKRRQPSAEPSWVSPGSFFLGLLGITICLFGIGTIGFRSHHRQTRNKKQD